MQNYMQDAMASTNASATRLFHQRDMMEMSSRERLPLHGEIGAMEKDAQMVRQHKDSMQRYTSVDGDQDCDHYLDAHDGKLRLLKVQVAPGLRHKGFGADEKSWSAPAKVGAFTRSWRAVQDAPIRITRWTYAISLATDKKGASKAGLFLRYPVACIALMFTVLTGSLEGVVFMGGRYMPVRYQYFCYPKDARNKHENYRNDVSYEPSLSTQSTNEQSRLIAHRPEQDDGTFARHLRPRFLCVISDRPEHPDGYQIVKVDEWDRTRRSGVSGGYVFVSYTRAQFQTYRPFQPPEERKHDSESAKQSIDVLCLGDVEAKHDSHRICDIARACDRMVIALKDDYQGRYDGAYPKPIDALLQSWASRLWTVPELLLAPTRHDFAIYHIRAGDVSSKTMPAEVIPKRNMAERAYHNGALVRQLVDHFESNLVLTQTELLTIGLQCLLSRQFRAFFPADVMYALMTLARRRPVPSREQTMFEAFAYMSLLNDSNLLLERLVCLLPPVRGAHWTDMDDFWHCKLWDIVPNIQVAALASNDSVLIDGAYGASIEWAALNKVGFLKRNFIWRTLGNAMMRGALFYILGACILLGFSNMSSSLSSSTSSGLSSSLSSSLSSVIPASSSSDGANPMNSMHYILMGIGVTLLVIGLAIVAALPFWILGLYRGKFWSTQAQLFGLEGVADIAWLEQELFGICQGRLKWAAHGSTQSHHQRKTLGEHLEDECEATTPSQDALPTMREDMPPDHLFTLVDTYSMTAMVFRAMHPPSVALVCGQEGGMRRALLCSYDYKTQTFHRESVVRMPTKVLDRMDRVNKFRFSMSPMP
ncbi:hypothetical protein ACEQ8H_008006 [Pleosporales sp. CAS-2024a]